MSMVAQNTDKINENNPGKIAIDSVPPDILLRMLVTLSETDCFFPVSSSFEVFY